jgi:hypothetical protein
MLSRLNFKKCVVQKVLPYEPAKQKSNMRYITQIWTTLITKHTMINLDMQSSTNSFPSSSERTDVGTSARTPRPRFIFFFECAADEAIPESKHYFHQAI